MALLSEHHGQLRADFRRFYGDSLDGFRAAGVPLSEVADMAANLPEESACFRAMNPNWQHDHALELARSTEYAARWLVWAKTGDGQKNRNQPEPYLFPWEEKQDDAIRGDLMTIDEAAEWLGWTDAA